MNAIKKCLFLILLLLVSCFPDAKAEGAGDADNLGIDGVAAEFLRHSLVPSAEQAFILDMINSAPFDTEWTAVQDGKVYYVVLRPVQKSERPEIQARLEEMARNAANLRAYVLPFLNAMSSERKARYVDENAVSAALIEWEKSLEDAERLKTDFTISLFSKEWGFAVSRLQEERLNAFIKAIGEMNESSFDEAYCKVRASQALTLFQQGHYAQALPIYKEIQDFQKGNPEDYFNLAECLLRTGDRKIAIITVAETVIEFSDSINGLLLERAGEIFFLSAEDIPAE